MTLITLEPTYKYVYHVLSPKRCKFLGLGTNNFLVPEIKEQNYV